jgi:hypothetical protein
MTNFSKARSGRNLSDSRDPEPESHFGKSGAKRLYEFALIVLALLDNDHPVGGGAIYTHHLRENSATLSQDKTHSARRGLDRTSTSGDQDANGFHHSRRLADYRFNGPDGDGFRASPA